MKRKTQFKVSKKNIINFCKTTKDNNILHTQNYYKVKNNKFKNIVVPGIFLISKINQIISKKYRGAVLIDLVSNFKQPVYVNETNWINHRIKIINKKNNIFCLSAEIKNKSKIKAFIKLIYIVSSK
tara:strand:+ start:784 stop:1161 length:378 start_codon:yes stop_codon:yes gene_type:complete